MSSDNDDEKKDLTAIADIAEFLHELDPEVDSQLEHGDTTEEKKIEEPEEDFPQEFKVDKPGDEEEEESTPTEEFETEMEAKPVEESLEFPTETPEEESLETPEEESLETPEEESLETPEEESLETPEEESLETPEEENLEFSEDETAEESLAISPEEEVEEEVEEEEEPTREESQELETPTPPPAASAPPPPSSGGLGEVQDFAKNISVGQALTPGNPPFSIILKNIKYSEDAEDILRILKEFGIANDSNESIFKQGLDAGSVLISQISEYAAIILTHKFRQYDLEIMMGLADEIHPPKIRESKGLISKLSPLQNKDENADLNSGVESPDIILLSTTPTLENFKINRYIGIITEHAKISEEEVNNLADDFDQNFGALADKLKAKAFKLRGNAVVGITYQMTPQKKGHTLTCFGNVVWVSPIES